MKELRYTLGLDDVLHAVRLYDSVHVKPRLGMFASLIPVLWTMYLIMKELSDPESASLAPVFISFAVTSLATAAAFFVVWEYRRRFIQPRLARRIFEPNHSLRREQIVRWNADEIEFSTEKSHSTEETKHFLRWLADADMMLLFRSEFSYHPIPSRAFSPDALREDLLRALKSAGVEGRRLGK